MVALTACGLTYFDVEKIVISLINFQVELAMKFVETLEINTKLESPKMSRSFKCFKLDVSY